MVMKYDGLWQRRFPYILAFHQAPADTLPQATVEEMRAVAVDVDA